MVTLETLMICTKDPSRKFCPELKNRVSKNGHSSFHRKRDAPDMVRNHRYSGLYKLQKKPLLDSA
jgi:hypothetical protein